MKKGYDIFGKAIGVMLRNDLHDIHSIDHKFMQEMIVVDDESYEYLYSTIPTCLDMHTHQMYEFSKQFRGRNDFETISNILKYTSHMANTYTEEFSNMLFGGTEKEIIERGTDWCADLARVCAVLLMCNDIPTRIVHLANTTKAYHGHVVVEAYYDGQYRVCDPVYGYSFDESAYMLSHHKQFFNYPLDYVGLYSACAINEYNPMDTNNNYVISKPNDYYMKLIYTEHNDTWFMGEDK